MSTRPHGGLAEAGPFSPARLHVRLGARVSGAIADAVVTINQDEHTRRVCCGVGGVDQLGVLDALMCLPTEVSIPIADLNDVARWHLYNAPPGCVEWLPGELVRRQLMPACSVDLVVVGASSWRAGLRRAAEFEPFAAAVVRLERRPRDVADIAWEADAASVGLWVAQADGSVDEVVQPTPFVRRYVKPAGWRFTERAYSAWISATAP